MLRSNQLVRHGEWDGSPADIVELDFLERHRRRLRLTGTRGLSFLLDLPRTTVMRDGDALVLNDGRLVVIAARAEPVMDAFAQSPQELGRLAWHVGNRHLPAEIGTGFIRLRHDHVIADMLRGLGAHVHLLVAPFNPEAGAYAAGGSTPGHGHDHDHLAQLDTEHAHG